MSHRPRARRRTAALTVLLGVLGAPFALAAPAAHAAVPAHAGRFVPVVPARLFDSRTSGGKLAAGSTVQVAVAGQAGIPASGVVAVALNLTATDADAAGFVTAYPSGQPQPSTSSLNVITGDTRANAAVTALGADGAITVFSLSSAHVVVDVAGYWEAASGAVTAGRFVSLAPARVLDTRDGTGVTAGQRPAGSTITLAVGGQGGVPSGGAASAVVLSVTATDVTHAGFVAVDAGSTATASSNLNVAVGGTRSNLVFAPLAADGTVRVTMQAGGNVLADVLGYFTGASAASSTAGLLVPLDQPARLLDTRDGSAGVTRLASQQSVAVRVGGRAGIPLNAAGVTGNVTVVDPVRPGWASVWPGDGPWPGSSNLNVEERGQLVPAAFASGASNGRISVQPSVSADVLVDVTAWFTPAGAIDTGAGSGPLAEAGAAPGPVEYLYDDIGWVLSPAAVPGHVAPPLPPDSGTGRRLVYSTGQQRAWAVEADGRVIRSWLVSGSAVPWYNEVLGTYHVFVRTKVTPAANHFPAILFWFVGFYTTVRGNTEGFHQIPVGYDGKPIEEVSQLGTRKSGGCVRQATEDALFTWNWAPIGTTVVLTS